MATKDKLSGGVLTRVYDDIDECYFKIIYIYHTYSE